MIVWPSDAISFGCSIILVIDVGAMSNCDVILAVYNGRDHLAPMLDSLLGQTINDFNVMARDNGSNDGTLEILERYKDKFDGRLRIIQGEPTGSARGNFTILMQETKADYVLCADHDDVWMPDKVEITLRSMKEAEAKFGKSTPIYFFTDVVVVNKDLEVINSSYWNFKRIDPGISARLSQCLICAPMLGMASGMNRALVDLSNPVPGTVTGHDWWALLVAAAMGKVVYNSARTALYRIHGQNNSAPKQVGIILYLNAKLGAGFVRHGLGRRMDQADALIEVYGQKIPPAQMAILQGFSKLRSQGFFRRRMTLVAHNYLYPDLARNVATLALM
jgi:glycosyltransferase involved in cell wall biosynthesis